uniref:DnaD domain protein n=1 Tax=Lentilactobacillus hilgardii TaxID=1588 RepID=UPI00403F7CB5
MNSYFSHDSNARNSEKLIKVRMKYGTEGYGVYFMILERLREEQDYMSIKDYNVIAFDLRVDASEIKSIVEDFGLFVFTEDGKYFYSEGFKKRMALKDKKVKSISEARKKAAKARWGNPSNANAMQTHSKDNANAMQNDAKKSKGKKSKVNKNKPQQDTGGDLSKLIDLFQDNIGTANPLTIEDIGYEFEDWQKLNSNQAFDIIKLAIKIASDSQHHSWAYVKGILKRWREQNGTSLTQIEALNAKHTKNQTVKGGSYDGIEY